jgi:tetratricopeptide (TPR) repeat protein
VKKIKNLIFIFVLLLLRLQSVAQSTTDEQLASQYYQNKEFDKALDYYEKLYDKKSAALFYTPYLNCLIETKDFKKGEKLIKKQLKNNPEKLNYLVDLGNLYSLSEDADKAKSTWNEAVKSIKQDEQVFAVANAFIAVNQFDYAIAAYLKGKKISQNNYPYSFELADMYQAKGDKLAMINEYLNVLEISDSYIQSVQNALQTSFGNEADAQQNELLKNELLKHIQRNADNTIFSELLIWMELQLKNWESALVQAKALDKRKKEGGAQIMELAQLFTQNEAYEIAEKAYQYVISKGVENPFYIPARMELLNVSYQKITSKGIYTPVDLTLLENNYINTVSELGKSVSTAPLLKNLAHLKAFYLHKPAEAITILEEVIAMPQLPLQTKAEYKLELGDILLATGDVWEASLRYSQVEKDFKHDQIGQEAKFRNAKISYYTGDFKWAQAQLDVLKGATSKLISNDAMDLSLLISDALAIDTTIAPLLIFARADLLAFQNKDEEAKTTLDSISKLFPNHSLVDDILFKKAQLAIKHSEYNEAAAFYDTIVKYYGQDILGDDALFKLAELNENEFKNIEKAKALYQQLIENYPGSLYVVEARKRFRKLRGDLIN